jgi:hypothetical protein
MTTVICLLLFCVYLAMRVFFTQEPAPWTKEGQARIAELGLTMQASDIFSCFYDHEFNHCKWLNDPTFFLLLFFAMGDVLYKTRSLINLKNYSEEWAFNLTIKIW